MAKTKNKAEKNSDDFEKLGRRVDKILEQGHFSSDRIYKVNFFRGVFFGLGVALGGSLVFAALAWIFTLFEEIPFIGDVVEVIRQSIESS